MSFDTPSLPGYDDGSERHATNSWASSVDDDNAEGVIEPDEVTDDAQGSDEESETGEDASELHDEDEHTAKSPKRSNSRSRATRLTPAQVRRVLAKAAELDNASPAVRDVVAAATLADPTTEELVVAALATPKGAVAAIGELLQLLALSPFESMVRGVALMSDRDTSRRAWAVLTTLGYVDAGIPAKEVAAGAKLAEAVSKLEHDEISTLEAAHELLGG